LGISTKLLSAERKYTWSPVQPASGSVGVISSELATGGTTTSGIGAATAGATGAVDGGAGSMGAISAAGEVGLAGDSDTTEDCAAVGGGGGVVAALAGSGMV
jgi:hypothetical protein